MDATMVIPDHNQHRKKAQDPFSGVRTLFRTLNGPRHKQAIQVFMMIFLAHLADHLIQVYQVYVLKFPESRSHGLLVQLFPGPITSETTEWFHHGFAFIMLTGLVVLARGFTGQARRWWNLALAIQIWHFFEHTLLTIQVVLQKNLFGSSVPMSILQLVIPRVELHVFYTGIVFIPMFLAILYEFAPPLKRRPY